MDAEKSLTVQIDDLAEFIFLLGRHPELWPQIRQILEQSELEPKGGANNGGAGL